MLKVFRWRPPQWAHGSQRGMLPSSAGAKKGRSRQSTGGSMLVARIGEELWGRLWRPDRSAGTTGVEWESGRGGPQHAHKAHAAHATPEETSAQCTPLASLHKYISTPFPNLTHTRNPDVFPPTPIYPPIQTYVHPPSPPFAHIPTHSWILAGLPPHCSHSHRRHPHSGQSRAPPLQGSGAATDEERGEWHLCLAVFRAPFYWRCC